MAVAVTTGVGDRFPAYIPRVNSLKGSRRPEQLSSAWPRLGLGARASPAGVVAYTPAMARPEIGGDDASHGDVLWRETAAVRRLSDLRGPRTRCERSGHQGPDRPARLGVRQAGLQGRHRQEGQGRPAWPRLRPQ